MFWLVGGVLVSKVRVKLEKQQRIEGEGNFFGGREETLLSTNSTRY